MDKTGTPKPDDNSGKPKQNPKKLTFTLEDLIFQDSFNAEGHGFLSFVCLDKCIITVRRWDYLELLNTIYEILEDEDPDTVVFISPDYEELDEKVSLSVTKFDLETRETESSTKEVPHYNVFNLLKNLSPDIREGNFNLN